MQTESHDVSALAQIPVSPTRRSPTAHGKGLLSPHSPHSPHSPTPPHPTPTRSYVLQYGFQLLFDVIQVLATKLHVQGSIVHHLQLLMDLSKPCLDIFSSTYYLLDPSDRPEFGQIESYPRTRSTSLQMPAVP